MPTDLVARRRRNFDHLSLAGLIWARVRVWYGKRLLRRADRQMLRIHALIDRAQTIAPELFP